MLPIDIVELLASREKYDASCSSCVWFECANSCYMYRTYSFQILTKMSSFFCRQVFLSDSENEKAEVKHNPRKKKKKSSGLETIILNDMRPPDSKTLLSIHCIQHRRQGQLLYHQPSLTLSSV
ncbi:hypothetical protein Dsin_010377 [Dipteronia sinensis]|uniref:Uncharacterized protein n=1 Tax=Dipteronia sinensis TaxID=43782 RepID=A0AAE0ASL6_9ROSI|nr:hypothetical protein Dsin_010377 [Dipteronia sinensis]